MKRLTLLAVATVVATVAVTAPFAEAQVIGTYRPSLATYYPSATSVTPVAYYKPITPQYPSNVYATSPAATYPASYTATTVPAPQTISPTPIVQTSYYGTPAYSTAAYSAPQVAYSPVAGNNCGCSPIQTVANTSYYPTSGCAPVSYQQPVYQTVAYQQPVAPVQPIAAQPGLIDGKWYVGKGLLGRPKLYAEGQPIRNAFRTVLP